MKEKTLPILFLGLSAFRQLRKRNTAASLSEGFAGSHHQGTKPLVTTKFCAMRRLLLAVCQFVVLEGALATNVPWPGRPGVSKRVP